MYKRQAMFLVSYLDGVPVCGLPGCVMYAKRTFFDLFLPRLLADDPITCLLYTSRCV